MALGTQDYGGEVPGVRREWFHLIQPFSINHEVFIIIYLTETLLLLKSEQDLHQPDHPDAQAEETQVATAQESFGFESLSPKGQIN